MEEHAVPSTGPDASDLAHPDLVQVSSYAFRTEGAAQLEGPSAENRDCPRAVLFKPGRQLDGQAIELPVIEVLSSPVAFDHVMLLLKNPPRNGDSEADQAPRPSD